MGNSPEGVKTCEGIEKSAMKSRQKTPEKAQINGKIFLGQNLLRIAERRRTAHNAWEARKNASPFPQKDEEKSANREERMQTLIILPFCL